MDFIEDDEKQIKLRAINESKMCNQNCFATFTM